MYLIFTLPNHATSRLSGEKEGDRQVRTRGEEAVSAADRSDPGTSSSGMNQNASSCSQGRSYAKIGEEFTDDSIDSSAHCSTPAHNHPGGSHEPGRVSDQGGSAVSNDCDASQSSETQLASDLDTRLAAATSCSSIERSSTNEDGSRLDNEDALTSNDIHRKTDEAATAKLQVAADTWSTRRQGVALARMLADVTLPD